MSETPVVEDQRSDEQLEVNSFDGVLDELETLDPDEGVETPTEIEEPAQEQAVEEKPAEEPAVVEEPAKVEPAADKPQIDPRYLEQQRKIAELEKKLSTQEKRFREAGLVPDEELQAEAEAVDRETLRAQQLEMLAETTRMMRGYQDLDTVVTKPRFDDTVNNLSQIVAQKAGIAITDAYNRVLDHIWSNENPWKYMHDLIKSSHADFEPKEAPAPAPVETKKEMKAVAVPNTLAAMQGGESAKSGWTAGKIDALPEEELNKVPKDVYDKYLRGELD